ncbi:hypothetical protein EOE66_02165 [Rubrivivax rivuli]|uniref:Uncharacterized protein n=1 Tax=Rubrivivax rivuli TaxID=1862385 RepID=A0A437RRV2_9BURK|nr:hypothetical protein EOE66_02165 [Rubrivivax rivuli]
MLSFKSVPLILSLCIFANDQEISTIIYRAAAACGLVLAKLAAGSVSKLDNPLPSSRARAGAVKTKTPAFRAVLRGEAQRAGSTSSAITP